MIVAYGLGNEPSLVAYGYGTFAAVVVAPALRELEFTLLVTSELNLWLPI